MPNTVRATKQQSLDGRELACSKCGRYKFPDIASAHYHEFTCTKVGQNNKGPWKCKGCGKHDFTRPQAFGSHRSICLESRQNRGDTAVREHKQSYLVSFTTRFLGNIKPASLGSFRIQLSDFNYLVTEWVEIIQAGEQDAQSSRNRQHKVSVGDIGLRCVACRQAEHYAPGSIMFPGCLKHFSHIIYNLAGRHMMASCPSMPAEIKKQLAELKQTTTSQSMCKERLGLPVYLQMVFKEMRLQDRQKGHGVVRVETQICSHWKTDPRDETKEECDESSVYLDSNRPYTKPTKQNRTRRKRQKRRTRDDDDSSDAVSEQLYDSDVASDSSDAMSEQLNDSDDATEDSTIQHETSTRTGMTMTLAKKDDASDQHVDTVELDEVVIQTATV